MLVRKTVTILFADVVDSTPLGERLDPEATRWIMQRWFAAMQEPIERHGGTVEKFVGDEVMAVFGVPIVHADDAVRAVRAAAEMRARLDALNDELEGMGGIRLAMRVGINTGEVVAGDPATGASFVTGDAVVVAKRLQQAASDDEILIGKATYPLVKDAVVAGPLQTFSLKGKRDPAPARRLDSVEPSAPGVARRLDAPLVGRRRELELLRTCFDAAVANRSCELLTLVGAAGIGKSRLAAEFLSEVRDEATAMIGHCLPYGDGITFWPLGEIVRSVEPLEDALAGTDDAEIVAERVRGLTGAAPPHSSEEAFWAVRRLIETLAHVRPVVVCLEDIHWAETKMLELIEYLHGWTRDAPVVLLCLARPDLIEARRGWVDPRPHSHVVAVDPLSRDQSRALVATVAGALTADARARIADAAEGNPLFAEQMAAHAVETGDDATVPTSIQALLSERLDRLDSAERAVLERAAVVGRNFPRGAVAALVAPDARDRLGEHLLSLVRKELVRPDVSPFAREDGFRFRHALIHDAAYDGMPKEVRAALHERLADWLEQREEDHPELDEILGFHLERAHKLHVELGIVREHGAGLAQRAGESLSRAALRAYERDDTPAALKLSERALALLPFAGARRAEVLLARGGALWSSGEADAADAVIAEAIDAARAEGEPRIEWSARLERAAWHMRTRDDTTLDDMLRLAHEAADVFATLGDEAGLANAWRRVARVASARRQFRDAERAASRALVHAIAARDRHEEARSVDALCTALYFGPTPADDAVAQCEQMLESAAGRPSIEANVLAALGGLLAMRRDLPRARTSVAEALEIYDGLALRVARAGTLEVAAYVELLGGDLNAAERLLREAVEIVEAAGIRSGVIAYRTLLADVLLAAGRIDDADDVCPPADAPTNNPLLLSVRGRVAAFRGNGDGIELARRAADSAAKTDALNERGDTLAHLGFALRDAGAPAVDAGAALAEAVGLYEAKGNVSAATRLREAAGVVIESRAL